ncbi:MAG: vitamin K epoxide reductase family protein [Actinomycetota bacterium]
MRGAASVERALRVALAVVAVAGLGVSIYLTVERARGRAPSCVVGGGCGTVQASRYAELAGIPVAWLGIAGYAGLLTAAALPGAAGGALGLLVAVIAAGFSGWLTYVELGILHAVCFWCVTSAVLVGIALLICVARLAVAAPRPAPA